jgi:hypothetical protein
MTTSIPPTGGHALEGEVTHVRALLAGLARTIRGLQQRLQTGEAQTLADAGAAMADLRAMVRIAIETEKRFEKCQQQETGRGDARRLELETARDTIGRRLDRLRAARDAGEVSE